jgi:NtrC-family two-component system sensor histidine kinase KinB
MDMEFEPVEVSLLADRAMSTMVAQISEKGIELSQHIPDRLPAVKVDPNKITWVLTNLIANALRYTNKGGHITVGAEKMSNFVGVSVADDGVGIPLEHQSKIFDKFVQVKSDQAVGGSGLGLAICKEIIKAHGGAIWVESAPGEGSTFTFTIPIANHPSTSP